jgi:hypothetical protein
MATKGGPAVYVCVTCERRRDAESARRKHRPTGYYFAVLRVTESGNHYATMGEVFACDKECAEEYVKYGMSHSFEPV